MDFAGQGKSAAPGLPTEAVVQDLCDLRDNVDNMAIAVRAVRDGLELANATLAEILEVLRTQFDEGLEETRAFRSEMQEVAARLKEVRDAVERDTESRGPAQP